MSVAHTGPGALLSLPVCFPHLTLHSGSTHSLVKRADRPVWDSQVTSSFFLSIFWEHLCRGGGRERAQTPTLCVLEYRLGVPCEAGGRDERRSTSLPHYGGEKVLVTRLQRSCSPSTWGVGSTPPPGSPSRWPLPACQGKWMFRGQWPQLQSPEGAEVKVSQGGNRDSQKREAFFWVCFASTKPVCQILWGMWEVPLRSSWLTDTSSLIWSTPGGHLATPFCPPPAFQRDRSVGLGFQSHSPWAEVYGL